jgi:hypothetical protein
MTSVMLGAFVSAKTPEGLLVVLVQLSAAKCSGGMTQTAAISHSCMNCLESRNDGHDIRAPSRKPPTTCGFKLLQNEQHPLLLEILFTERYNTPAPHLHDGCVYFNGASITLQHQIVYFAVAARAPRGLLFWKHVCIVRSITILLGHEAGRLPCRLHLELGGRHVVTEDLSPDR